MSLCTGSWDSLVCESLEVLLEFLTNSHSSKSGLCKISYLKHGEYDSNNLYRADKPIQSTTQHTLSSSPYRLRFLISATRRSLDELYDTTTLCKTGVLLGSRPLLWMRHLPSCRIILLFANILVRMGRLLHCLPLFFYRAFFSSGLLAAMISCQYIWLQHPSTLFFFYMCFFLCSGLESQQKARGCVVTISGWQGVVIARLRFSGRGCKCLRVVDIDQVSRLPVERRWFSWVLRRRSSRLSWLGQKIFELHESVRGISDRNGGDYFMLCTRAFVC